MNRDLVYLNENRDIVSLDEATWAVETFRDEDGKVISETWGKIKSVSARSTPATRPVNASEYISPNPTHEGTPAITPTLNKMAILTGFVALLLAIISARFTLPDLLTGLLAGTGLGIGLYALFGRQNR